MKLKKTLFVFSSTIVFALPLALLNCGGTSYKYFYTKKGNDRESIPDGNEVRTGEKVSFLTDGGALNDRSFNEGALNGVKKWSAKQSLNTFKIYEVQNGGNSDVDYDTAYQSAMTSSQNGIMVVVGFKHADNGNTSGKKRINKFRIANKGKKIIGIDIPNDDPNDKFYGITFKTEQSGFMAAFEAGYQINKQFEKEDSKDPIKVATFGGASIPPVVAFMNGFVKGIVYFNENKPDGLRELKLIHIDDDDPKKDFTKTFTPGDGKQISQTFIDKGARLIFPVAGSQTIDAIEAIKNKKKLSEVFVIGVDVDQSQTLGGTIIGSAFKGLTSAAESSIQNLQDKEYSLQDNTENKKYVGYVPNKYYESSVTSQKRIDAKNAAKAFNAFANPYYTAF